MDLSTTYLGLELPHPFMAGASILSEDLDTVKRLEDAGSAAIVMESLFEEQITAEQMSTHVTMESAGARSAEAISFFPDPPDFRLGPEEYLENISKAKEAVDVPVIGSLNGASLGGWLDYAKLIEEAGADALELNVYYMATNPKEFGLDIRHMTNEMISTVKSAVKIPVAVKMSQFYTSVANAALDMTEAGADGLVLFNRFYQPDIDIEELEVIRSLRLSDSSELNLRLRWLAVLYGKVGADLAVTGGVHTPVDAIKAIMCGAQVVQMVSALLKNGPEHLKAVRQGLEFWLVEHEYESLNQMLGSMSLDRCPDPAGFERANYMHILKSWGH